MRRPFILKKLENFNPSGVYGVGNQPTNTMLIATENISGVDVVTSLKISDGVTIYSALKELIGVGGNFIPVNGTDENDPVTGDIEIKELDKGIWIKGASFPDAYSGLLGTEGGMGFYSKDYEGQTDLSVNPSGVNVSSTNPLSKGIVGNEVYDKQSDQKAYAQIGDLDSGLSYKFTKDVVETIIPANDAVFIPVSLLAYATENDYKVTVIAPAEVYQENYKLIVDGGGIVDGIMFIRLFNVSSSPITIADTTVSGTPYVIRINEK